MKYCEVSKIENMVENIINDEIKELEEMIKNLQNIIVYMNGYRNRYYLREIQNCLNNQLKKLKQNNY